MRLTFILTDIKAFDEELPYYGIVDAFDELKIYS